MKAVKRFFTLLYNELGGNKESFLWGWNFPWEHKRQMAQDIHLQEKNQSYSSAIDVIDFVDETFFQL